MELYYVCISEKNNGHCKRIIGEIERIYNGQKIGALKNRIIGKILSIIYQGLISEAKCVRFLMYYNNSSKVVSIRS